MSCLELPDELWQQVASNLETPDLLHFLSSHRRFHEGLGGSNEFWDFMIGSMNVSADQPAKKTNKNEHNCSSRHRSRQAYMMHSYQRHLPVVKWHRLTRQNMTHSISAREGHLSCVLKQRNGELLCITGGFTEDQHIYMLHIPTVASNDSKINTSGAADSGLEKSSWHRGQPEGPHTFIYGASLTALDSTRAVRFGGFRGGGYSAECNTVALLTIEQRPNKNDDDDNDDQNGLWKGKWEVISTQNSQFAPARAYHTATLLNGHYLVIVGGMREDGCIMDISILNTKNWTWLDPSRFLSSFGLGGTEPSPRHGHSVVLDEKRNRLVLFGGGSGTDLLRSGEDNSEVWGLYLGNNWSSNLEDSFPWSWSIIHKDSHESEDQVASRGPGGVNDSYREERSSVNQLSPAECLCLGRCHNSIKLAPDMVLMIFGSGSPSTNGILAYNLQKDSFHRPSIEGFLPQARFTGISSLVHGGYVFCHGGFSSQDGSTLCDINVLDLVPKLRQSPYPSLLSEPRTHLRHEPVTDEDARQGRMSGERLLRRMFDSLGNASEDERPAMAQEMMGELIASGQFGGQAFMLMRMIANGSAVVRFSDSDSDEVDHNDDEMDEDSEYVEGN